MVVALAATLRHIAAAQDHDTIHSALACTSARTHCELTGWFSRSVPVRTSVCSCDAMRVSVYVGAYVPHDTPLRVDIHRRAGYIRA